MESWGEDQNQIIATKAPSPPRQPKSKTFFKVLKPKTDFCFFLVLLEPWWLSQGFVFLRISPRLSV
jgi:hypothetical protein